MTVLILEFRAGFSMWCILDITNLKPLLAFFDIMAAELALTDEVVKDVVWEDAKRNFRNFQ